MYNLIIYLLFLLIFAWIRIRNINKFYNFVLFLNIFNLVDGSVLWIRIRIGSVLRSFLNPYFEYGSGYTCKYRIKWRQKMSDLGYYRN